MKLDGGCGVVEPWLVDFLVEQTTLNIILVGVDGGVREYYCIERAALKRHSSR